MKRLALLFSSLILLSSVFAQRANPVAGCKITKDYGMESVTYYLTCTVHIAKEGEFVNFRVYDTKGKPADMVIKFVDFNPRFCGEWRMTENEGYAIKFVDSPDDATFTVKFGEPSEVYGHFGEPY